MKIILKQFQEDYLFTHAPYPAFVAAWGTGKTMTALDRGIALSEQYPGNAGLIGRREFTDLHDSTMADYKTYTGREVNGKDDVLPNGSRILFRHAKELTNNLLKNLNLGWFFLEQAEEFDSEAQFFLLRGRLRRKGVGLHTGFITANVKGHNWIWKLWKQNKNKDGTFKDPKYPLYEANTFDNKENLPADYLENLEDLRLKAPSIYNQYVLNSWEEAVGGRWFITALDFENALRTRIAPAETKILVTCDPSLGDNKTVIYGMKNTRIIAELVLEAGVRDTMKIAGEIGVLAKKIGATLIVIDTIGIGQGIADRLVELGYKVYYLNSAAKASDSKRFINVRAEMWWNAMQKFTDSKIDLLDDGKIDMDTLKKQLTCVQYDVVDSSGKIQVEDKDDIKAKLNGESPDHADAYVMGLHALPYAPTQKRRRDVYEQVPEERTSAMAA